MRQQSLKTTIITVLLTMSCITTSAQLLQATRSHYSTDNGLCSNSISDLEQDDYGFLWIATWNGLSRFDGYNFVNYRTGAGSHIRNLHNRILSLSIDYLQNVWMRMYDNRVFVLKRSTDCIINPFEGINGYEGFRTNCDVMVATNGDVLVSIEGTGIYCVRPTQTGFESRLITINEQNVRCMTEGYQGDIWVGTNEGVHRIDAGNMTLERKGQFLDEDINCIFSNGYNIYAGTASGKIVTFAYGRDPEVLRSGNMPITALFVDSHGLVWFCDDRHGGMRLNPATGDEKLFQQEVTVPDYDGQGGIFTEAYGRVWTRLNHGGYGYYNRETDAVEYFHNDPSNPWNLINTVYATLELEEGVVFESTGRRGLEKLEIRNNTITLEKLIDNPQSNLANEYRAMYYDRERYRLLIANKESCIFIFNNDGTVSQTITHDDNGHSLGRCYGLNKDSKGNYWLASKDYGVFRITPLSDNQYSVVNMSHSDSDPNSLSDNRAYDCVEDKNGNIWVATYGGGVNVLTHDASGKEVFLHKGNGMHGYPPHSHLKVRTIELGPDGDVWAGTTDGILLMTCENAKVDIKQLEASEEFPDSILYSNDIVCMSTDFSGTMWIGTNGGGIAHATSKDSQGRWLFNNYGARDGLPSEEIKSLACDSKGKIWLATDNKICSFDPKKEIFTTFSSLDGVDETLCSEGGAVVMSNDNVLIGTTEGYYIIDRQKLMASNASILKLRITDFYIDDQLQSPRLNDNYDFYVPESKTVTLPAEDSHFSIRFAALNYQLQHRIHYQYILEGYDKAWRNADKTLTASYPDLPAGTYNFMVKAFLLESPEYADIKEITIIVPPHFLESNVAFWLYILVAAALIVALVMWLLRKRNKGTGNDNKSTKRKVHLDIFRKKKQQPQHEPQEETDSYTIIE